MPLETITDEAFLKTLGAPTPSSSKTSPVLREISDADFLQSLGEPAGVAPPPAPVLGTPGDRNRKLLLERLQGGNLFQSASTAFAAGEGISKRDDGQWRLPAMAKSGEGVLGSLMPAAAGLVQKDRKSVV